jgi:hypothetical protein
MGLGMAEVVECLPSKGPEFKTQDHQKRKRKKTPPKQK